MFNLNYFFYDTRKPWTLKKLMYAIIDLRKIFEKNWMLFVI